MRLFIWEGNGISEAYHDDGTLVVLAETPEQAREVVAEVRRAWKRRQRADDAKLRVIRGEMDVFAAANGGYSRQLWETPGGKALLERQAKVTARQSELHGLLPDGSPDALLREPDRIVDLDVPRIVAFNGGGYD